MQLPITKKNIIIHQINLCLFGIFWFLIVYVLSVNGDSEISYNFVHVVSGFSKFDRMML